MADSDSKATPTAESVDADDMSTEDKLKQLATYAERLKTRGNELLKEGKRDAALALYTQGIEAAEASKSDALASALYGNRAQVYLGNREWNKVVNDCRKAVKADKHNVKAYWRAAKASLSEKLWQQAIDLSREGLSANPGNKDLEKMLADAEAQLQRYREKKASKQSSSSISFVSGGDSRSDEVSPEEAMEQQRLVKELNDQYSGVRQQLRSAEVEKAKTGNARDIIQNMLKEDSQLHTYRAVGKCFILSDSAELTTDMSKAEKHLQENVIPQLKKSEEAISKRCKNAQGELDNMVKHLRKSPTATA
ncbi:conserved hypothetical protein [Perkinsus marinus ATCC 50983]|uniref:Uncharacterized protein n=1 Tax=Perkinsus marinus (strain ATCC 50983 / TXsc) TaxID=423536 RepID=C5KHY9_PERM5|nr:conserved hypothetical protein [Perkinsus marinus ATCC 50983]EER16201.1 conserved hypothetical protein [Perkinsus marinus ATCC 50983]|eukprot:XP_002784405.1 conserved hypothetical protein [Perkinsus marinus ATCC 50983]